MSIGLTKQELEARNNDSLIKYIGCLQTELEMIYAGELPRSEQGVQNKLASSDQMTLNSRHEQES